MIVTYVLLDDVSAILILCDDFQHVLERSAYIDADTSATVDRFQYPNIHHAVHVQIRPDGPQFVEDDLALPEHRVLRFQIVRLEVAADVDRLVVVVEELVPFEIGGVVDGTVDVLVVARPEQFRALGHREMERAYRNFSVV